MPSAFVLTGHSENFACSLCCIACHSACQRLRDLSGDVCVVNLVALVFRTVRGFDLRCLLQLRSEKGDVSLSEYFSIACKQSWAGLGLFLTIC